MRIVNGPNTYQSTAVSFTTTDDAYADLDVVGGRLRFDFDLPAKGGVIEEIAVYDPDNVLLGQFDVFVYNRPPTVIADNAAFALADGELSYIVAYVPASDFTNEAIDSKGYNYARPALQFTTTNSRLYLYIRNNEGEDPLAFSDGKTVTVRVTVGA